MMRAQQLKIIRENHIFRRADANPIQVGARPYRPGRDYPVLFAYFFLYAPIVLPILTSFETGEVMRFPNSGYSLKWYRFLLSDYPTMAALGDSLVLAMISSLLAAVLGTLCALGLVRSDFFWQAARESIERNGTTKRQRWLACRRGSPRARPHSTPSSAKRARLKVAAGLAEESVLMVRSIGDGDHDVRRYHSPDGRAGHWRDQIRTIRAQAVREWKL